MYKILTLTNIPSYHQVDLFDKIQDLCLIKHLVLYTKHKTEGRLWSEMPVPKHDHKFLKILAKNSILYLNPDIMDEICSFKPDAIVVCQYAGISFVFAMLYSRYRNIPWAFWSESPGVKFFEVKYRIPNFLRKVLRNLLFIPIRKFSSDVWGIGFRAQQQYEKITKRKCKNLPYYSNLNKFKRIDNSYCPKETIRFLFLGNLSFRKGFDLILEALNNINSRFPRYKWTLDIYGHGEMLHLLYESRYLSIFNRIKYHGFKEIKEIANIIRNYDVLLAPSRYDGWGMVVPEALAAGLCVISSDQMGSAIDIGEKEFLQLIKTNDHHDLEKAILNLVMNYENIATKGTAAYKYSEIYDCKIGATIFCQNAISLVDE